jgi:uncharacterized protein
LTQIYDFRAAVSMATTKKERLLILGAGGGAAAQSAAAAGYEVIAADQFADRDLREICPDARPVKYPEGLLEFAMTVEPCAWMYTGALENYPEIVQKISERHELLGNGPDVLRRVRSRDELFGFLEQWMIFLPEISLVDPPPTRTWIIKRFMSGGGLGIRFSTLQSHLAKGEYYQEWVDGMAASVSFLANGLGAEPMYASQQFQSVAYLGAPPFHYSGGITASRWELPFPPRWRKFFKEFGHSFAQRFQLRGVFGIDFIFRDHALWLLEVNPRFTASMGLFECFFDASLVNFHVDVCRNNEPMDVPLPRFDSSYYANGILYTRDDFHITDRMSDRLWALRSGLDLADLPMGGSVIGKGQPVLTIFAEGDSREETMRSLESKANQLRALGIP